MKVKVFSIWNYPDTFEEEINEFLDENAFLIEVVDIRYSTTPVEDRVLYSAIILYENI
jgi:hypothetical protein